uniref:Uncharacterized protein n=1 Tax=Leersia perrieri TaxID=77586 RepID=A0A0D9V0F9_9ORYZ
MERVEGFKYPRSPKLAVTSRKTQTQVRTIVQTIRTLRRRSGHSGVLAWMLHRVVLDLYIWLVNLRLATAGYGTVLGVTRSLHSGEILEKAFYTGTRPFN